MVRIGTLTGLKILQDSEKQEAQDALASESMSLIHNVNNILEINK